VAGLDVPVREAPEAIVHAQLPVVPDDDVAMLVVRVRELRPGRG